MTAAANLFRAEWQKITGHRWVAGFLIWIFPVGAFIITFGAAFILLLSSEFRANQLQAGVAPWNETMLFGWDLVNNPFLGRPVILIFTAFIFAGEYTAGTWKNLVPRQTRVALILTKFFTLAMFVVTAFVLMTLVLIAGTGLSAAIVGADFGVSNAGNVMGEFLKEYALNALNTFVSVLIVACYAALAAMVTKNVTAASVIGIIMYLFETLGVIFFFLLVNFVLGWNLAPLYRFLPTFNLENMMQWLRAGEGFPFVVEDVTYATISLPGSVAIILAWAVGLIALTVWRFQRQDITT